MLALLSAPRGRVSPLRMAMAAERAQAEAYGIIIRLPGVQPAQEPVRALRGVPMTGGNA